MTTSKHAPLLVLGAGPGGYAAAFLAADFGLEVTLVDMKKNPGGICLFQGCIPSKALLHVAQIIANSREAREFGINFKEPEIHLDKILEWKNSIISKLSKGLRQLCKQRNISFIQGRATFLDSGNVLVQENNGNEQQLSFDQAIIATGSYPNTLPFAPWSSRILDSTSALNIEDIPKKLLVIGGGYIGLELGTAYCELGSAVSVTEMTPNLLPGVDRDLASILERRIGNRFEAIMLNTKIVKVEETQGSVTVAFENKDGKTSTEIYDKVLVAIGRKPLTQNLELNKTKVKLTEQGFVKVNSRLQTDDPNIYAIGDVAGEPMLAHKATHQGKVCAEVIAGKKVEFEPAAIPAVVFTDPEIAWCGLTENQAREQNRNVKAVKFPWTASGRAITLNRTDGLTKLIIDPETERILGVAIVGVGAGEMIAEGVLVVEMGAVATDVKLTIHPHPTLSETIMEAAEIFFGQSTHTYRPKKNHSLYK